MLNVRRILSRLAWYWSHLNIALKIRLTFFVMMLVIFLTASSSYLMLDAVRRKTDSAILTGVEIEQVVYQMDGGLEKARRMQRDFFLRYPQIGMAEARALYVQPALEQIRQVASLSQRLKGMVARLQMGDDVEFNLYFSAAERYAETFQEAVNLVTELADEQDGVQVQLAAQSQRVQMLLEASGNSAWIDSHRRIQLYTQEYLVTRRRSVMQSAFNAATLLQITIRNDGAISELKRGEILQELQTFTKIGERMVGLDADIRGKLNDFDLQAQSIDPISVQLLRRANEEMLRARSEIDQTNHLAKLVLGFTGLTGLVLAGVAANLLNRSITRNILLLTRGAQELESGNLLATVPVYSDDEFGNLAHAFNSMAQRLQNFIQRLQSSEKRYRGLFENSPVSLWEEDFSEIKNAIDLLRQREGIEDWRSYFTAHPEQVRRLVAMIRVLDVNRATLELFECDSKEVLVGSLGQLYNEQTHDLFRDEFSALASGGTVFESIAFQKTFSGKDAYCNLRMSIVPGFEDSWAKVLVSLGDITERRQHEHELASIATVSAAMRTANNSAEMLPVIVDQLTRLFNANGAAVVMVDAATGDKRVELAHGQLARLLKNKGWLEEYDYGDDNETAPVDFPVTLVRVPLIAHGKTIGTLWASRETPLSAAERRIFTAIADISANAIHRATLFEATQQGAQALAEAYEATIEGWSMALDLRDRETEGHTQRVTSLTLELGRAMGLSEADLVHMRRGALLHDIGKIGVPDEILRKPGPLNDKEWKIMRSHPELAFNLLYPIAYLHQALEIPYCHHERWDGSGYPRGLRGEQIPLAARIFAVIDVWDALLSDRPYRRAWKQPQVVAYLHEQSGKHFDPRVVECFIALQSEVLKLQA